MESYLFNLKIALNALLHNKVRSLLTALGIIFGVASVIAMQAIGKGAEQDILDKLKLVGINNIIITQKLSDPVNSTSNTSNKVTRKPNSTFGLSYADGFALKDVIPEIERFSPETKIKTFTVYQGRGYDANLNGVSAQYFHILSRTFESGHNFDSAQMTRASAVCILSPEAKEKFFHGEPAVGKYIRCGYLWLQVTGVLAPVLVSDSLKKKMGDNENDVEIFAPIRTVLLRYNDRSFVTKTRLMGNGSFDDDEETITKPEPSNYNQVDKLILQVSEPGYMQSVSEAASKILKRRHGGVHDFDVTIPEAGLKQDKETRETFNLVLGIIAGISLLVGGIGIMNIMLVSVTERTKEIGLRMALGARKKDIVQQFMAEAVMLSSSGGIIGVIIGIAVSKIISGYFHIPTIFTIISLFIAFAFSVGVGLVFGIAPAQRAAKQDPIESLRYE